MIIREKELPKIRLLIKMEILKNENLIYKNIIAAITCKRLNMTVICFKFNNEKIAIMNFEHKCLQGIIYYTLQNETTRQLTFLKFCHKDSFSSDNFIFYLMIGYGDGNLELYNFTREKFLKLQQFGSERNEAVLDANFANDCLLIVRKKSIWVYNKKQERFYKKAMGETDAIYSSYLKSKIYISHYYNFKSYTNALKEEINIQDYTYYCVRESNYNQNVLYFGDTYDTFKYIDLRTQKSESYKGFKSFVSSICEQYNLLWVVGLDGRAATFIIQGIQTERGNNNSRFDKNSYQVFAQKQNEFKFIQKIHPAGIWNMITQQQFMIIYDCDGAIAIYQVYNFSGFVTDRSSRGQT